MGGRQAQVWLASPESVLASSDVDAHLGFLSYAEQSRMERFRFMRDRQTFLATRILVRNALSALCEDVPIDAWRFTSGPRGRPELCAPRLEAMPRFSLSHTPGLLACVVAMATDCGVDVEAVDRELDVDALAPGVLSREEIAALDGVPAAARRREFLRYWTLKEAYAKALGLGLELSFYRITFAHGPHGIHMVGPGDSGENARDWQFASATTGEHQIAVALRCGDAGALPIVYRSGAP